MQFKFLLQRSKNKLQMLKKIVYKSLFKLSLRLSNESVFHNFLCWDFIMFYFKSLKRSIKYKAIILFKICFY